MAITAVFPTPFGEERLYVLIRSATLRRSQGFVPGHGASKWFDLVVAFKGERLVRDGDALKIGVPVHDETLTIKLTETELNALAGPIYAALHRALQERGQTVQSDGDVAKWVYVAPEN